MLLAVRLRTTPAFTAYLIAAAANVFAIDGA
jgi:hypothetical protein